jgi:hypothetical protein
VRQVHKCGFLHITLSAYTSVSSISEGYTTTIQEVTILIVPHISENMINESANKADLLYILWR